MFRSIAILLLGVFGCGSASTVVIAPGSPRLFIKEHTIELGDVFLQPDIRRVDVQLSNIGIGELHITELQRSCTCTEIVVDRTSVPTGEVASLGILVTIKEPGKHSASVTIHSDSDDENRQLVTVYWTGVAPIHCETLDVDFGSVRPGQTVERTVRLTRRNPKSRLISLTPSGEELKVGTIREDGDFIDVPVTLYAGPSRGRRSAQLVVKVEEGWPEEVSLPVQWSVRDSIEANPDKLFLGSVLPSQHVRRRVIISSLEGTTVKLGTITASPDQNSMAFTLHSLEGGPMALDIDWTAPSEIGVSRGQVRIQVVAPEEYELLVETIGYVVEPESKGKTHDSPKERNSSE